MTFSLAEVIKKEKMNFQWTLNVCLVLLVSIAVVSSREGSHEQMYKDIETNNACFRRLNGTHQFGCSSSKSGNNGIIHVIKTDKDLNEFLSQSTSESYVIVLYIHLFTREVVDQLLKVNNIAGLILVVLKSPLPDSYSPDETCPNSRMNSCGDDIINPFGNSFLFIDWPFPMFLVDDETTIDTLEKCFEDFNLPLGEEQLSKPLCSVQLKAHMSAALNTPTCLRRESEAGARVFKYCDPMGDRNVILPMVESQDIIQSKSAIVIAARLDTAALFDGVSSGAITSATSIVTLLTTANILSKMLKNAEFNDKGVIFMLFNGEIQDYIGSSRIIFDINNGDFQKTTALNLTLDDILTFIEISQIDTNSQVYLHSSVDETIQEFEKQLMTASSNYSIKISKSLLTNPPSSLQMFKKANPSLSGVVISSYDKEYTNKYYNGLLDTSNTIYSKYGNMLVKKNLEKNIAEISMSLASAVYSTITQSTKSVDDMEDVKSLVGELLNCYLESRFCKLMKEVYTGGEGIGQSSPWPMYVSVQPSLNHVTTATGLLLAYLTSEPIKLTQEACSVDSKYYTYYWINGPNNTGLCINSTLKFTPAVSPAFLIDNYDWTSANYSSWTESIWFDFKVTMFLRPSRRTEWIIFSIGMATFVVSFVLVYVLNKKAAEIFKSTQNNCSLLATSC